MQQNTLKLFVLPKISRKPWLPILELNFGVQKRNTLFQDIDPKKYEGIWELVDTQTEADYFIIPHSYNYIKEHGEYVKDCVEMARQYNKHIILFAYQDGAEPISIQRTIILRSSQYRMNRAANEIIMPAFVEDLGVMYGIQMRKKTHTPSVGFVGKAGFENPMHFVRFFIKNTLFRSHPYKDGLYYRRKAMSVLNAAQRSKKANIKTDFIVRSSYSGNIKSIPLDPAQARTEYVHNIIENDFTLAPKGDGNYSLRLYETLSLGRIPILIDTDTPLPLEDKIAYDDIILRVPHTDIGRLPEIIARTFTSWTPEQYNARQQKAREVFETYLYMPAFLRTVFTKEFLSQYHPS